MPTPTAGRFLQNALSRAGITARPDGDSGSDYIAIPVGDHGIIRIGGVLGRAWPPASSPLTTPHPAAARAMGPRPPDGRAP